MGCLYYIPARRFEGGRVPESVKPRRLAESGAVCLEDLGLGHLDGAPLTSRGCRNNGPDGGAGLVIGLRVPANETGVFKGEQAWMPCEGGGLYLGWSLEVAAPRATDGREDAQGPGEQGAGKPPLHSAPGPETFIRAGALDPTISVAMGDGNFWGLIETAALPSRAVYGKSGERTWERRASDAAHYEASKWLMEVARGGESVPYFDIIDRVAVCLGARYHMSPLEVFALGLFSMELSDSIVYACLGIDLAKADAEKKSGDERV